MIKNNKFKIFNQKKNPNPLLSYLDKTTSVHVNTSVFLIKGVFLRVCEDVDDINGVKSGVVIGI